MFDGVGHLDWFDYTVECHHPRCVSPSVFIIRFPDHPHFKSQWYPVCLLHEAWARETTCKGCGRNFTRSTIETL